MIKNFSKYKGHFISVFFTLCTAFTLTLDICAQAVLKSSNPEIVVQSFHTKFPIWNAIITKDEKFIFSSDGNDVRIWDTQTGNLIKVFSEETEAIDLFGVSFSPDGKYFACRSSKGDIIKVDTETRETTFLDSNKADYVLIEWSPNGKYIAVCNNDSDTISVYNVEKGSKEFSLKKSGFVFSKIKFSPLSSFLIATTDTYDLGEDDWAASVFVWDLKSQKLASSFQGRLKDAEMSSDESKIAYSMTTINEDGNYNGDILVNDFASGKKIISFFDNFSGTFPEVNDMKFIFNDGTILVTLASYYNNCILWNLSTGNFSLFYDSEHISEPRAIAVNQDRSRFVLTGFDEIGMYDTETGDELVKIAQPSSQMNFTYSVADDKLYLYGQFDAEKVLCVENDFSAEVLPDTPAVSTSTGTISATKGGIYYKDFEKLSFYNTKNKSLRNKASLGNGEFTVSDDGSSIATWDYKKGIVSVISADSWKVTEAYYTGKYEYISGFAVSPKNNYVALAGNNCTELLSLKNKTFLKFLVEGNSNNFPTSQSFSADERLFAINGKVYESATGSRVKSFGKEYGIRFVPGQQKIIVSRSNNLEVYDTQSWQLLGNIKSDRIIQNFAATRDGKRVITIGYDGTLCCYSLENFSLLATTIADTKGRWISFTPEGFFNGSKEGLSDFVHITNGLTITDISQFSESLYRPDLVASKISNGTLSKDTDETLKLAADSGTAPVVYFPQVPETSVKRDVTITINVQDLGGGIGNVYLSLNGKVIVIADNTSRKLELVGTGNGAAGKNSQTQKGQTVQYRHTVSLSNGENIIKAWATNTAGKIESKKVSAQITWNGQAEKPRLYVLAVGVNKYRDGSLRLKYAVPDATSIAKTFNKTKGNLYQKINVSTLLDEKVTKDEINAAFDNLAGEVRPDDVFVFYLSGHGTAHTDGDYYFIPVNFRYTNAASIPEQAVSKQVLTENLSKISAQKILVMLDTCNSGAFISGSQRGMAEKTAIDRLSRATGQAIISASSDSQAAMEGFKGHGIFTYVVLEALDGKADFNRDGYISLQELSLYIGNQVPDLSYEKWGYEQVPQVDLRKEDFPLAGK